MSQKIGIAFALCLLATSTAAIRSSYAQLSSPTKVRAPSAPVRIAPGALQPAPPPPEPKDPKKDTKKEGAPPPPPTNTPPPAPPPRVPPPPPPPQPVIRYDVRIDDTVEVPGGSRGGTTVPCTDGRVVTGGYTAFQSFDIPNQAAIVLTTRPASDGSGFVGLVENPLLASKATVTTHAICIARPAGYSIVQGSRTLNPRDRAYVDVARPAGSVLIGGGASTETGVHLAMSAPKLDGSAWSAYFRSDTIIGTKKAEAWAICAAPTIAGREVVSSPPSQLGPDVKMHMDVARPERAM